MTLSSHACTILEFAAENLLNPAQNAPQVTFEELAAFATDVFPTRPIFTGHEQFETGLNRPIDLAGFGYASVHYAPGTSGNPMFNRGGSLVFYYLEPDSCSLIFPQTGPGNSFSNGPITSVTLFSSVIPDAGATVLLFAIAFGGILLIIYAPRFCPLEILAVSHLTENAPGSLAIGLTARSVTEFHPIIPPRICLNAFCQVGPKSADECARGTNACYLEFPLKYWAARHGMASQATNSGLQN